MSIDIKNNKIIIPIEIATVDESRVDEYIEKLQQLQDGDFDDFDQIVADEIKDAIEEAVKEVGENSKGAIPAIGGSGNEASPLDGFKPNDLMILKDFMTGTPSPALLSKMFVLMSNPYIMGALLAAGLIPMIIDELYKAGGLLDPRFKRIVGDIALAEYEVLSNLEHKAAIKLGSKNIVVAASAGLRMGENQINNTYDRAAFDKVGIMGQAGLSYDTFLKSKNVRMN